LKTEKGKRETEREEWKFCEREFIMRKGVFKILGNSKRTATQPYYWW